MGSLARLVPYVWPQRYRLVLSVLLSIVAAALTALALMLVFPVVKLMLEGQGLHEYIGKEQRAAQVAIATQTTRLQELDAEMDRLRLNGPAAERRLCETHRAKSRSALKSAQSREWQFDLFARTLLPWVPVDRFLLLVWVMAALLVVTALKCGASCLVDLVVGSAVGRAMQTLRERMLRRTLQLDQQTLALETTPQLMSRFTFDLQQVSQGLVVFGGLFILEPLKALFCIGCAFGVNWRLTALSFACVPVGFLLFRRFGRGLKRASGRQLESMSRVFRVLDETLKSFRSVQAFRNERLHRRRLSHEHRYYYEKAMQIIRIDGLTNPSIEFLATVAVCLASLPGSYLVLHGQTSIFGVQLASRPIEAAELALLYSLLAGILDPARKLSSVFTLVKRSAAASDRVFRWMDRPSLVTAATHPVPLPRHGLSIEFDHVTFHYATLDNNSTRPPALDDVSLTIPFGAVVAVVGGNGSGKSTLVNLLPRFYDAQSGTVRIDGVDLREADEREARDQIGVVTQETLLFDRTIADNIAYGRFDATRAEIELAAQRAHVTEFARQMPDGLETGVGERGLRLSGGQRQRVALARAILRDPTILILDEATSAVDAHSEQLIHESLRDFARGRTTLIVTHALTTTLIELVTHVLVMEQGRAIAFGSHADVLATCPAYQRLFVAQAHHRAA